MRSSSEPYRPDAPIVAELASGAVVVLEGAAPEEVLLLHLAREDRWCLPKGHVEAGESLLKAARREVLEEAGLSGLELGEEVCESSYRFYSPSLRRNVLKVNVFFLGTARDKAVHLEELFDRAVWVRFERALELVPFEADRTVLRAARDLLARRLPPPSDPKKKKTR